MTPTSKRRGNAARVWSVIGAAIAGASLFWSGAYPTVGGIGSGVMVGTLLAFAYLVRISAPRVALGLAASALLVALAQAAVNVAALIYGAWAAGAAFALWWVLVEGVGMRIVNREHAAALTELGGTGSAGRALIVYHSVGGQFQPAVERGLADGLIRQGWRVDMTTASHRTPTEIGSYQLLVLGVPVFAAQPATPIQAYLKRLGDLHGKPVLLVISGQGTTEYGAGLLRKQVTAANGRVVDAVEVWTERDNAERHGTGDAVEALRQVGERLRLPA